MKRSLIGIAVVALIATVVALLLMPTPDTGSKVDERVRRERLVEKVARRPVPRPHAKTEASSISKKKLNTFPRPQPTISKRIHLLQPDMSDRHHGKEPWSQVFRGLNSLEDDVARKYAWRVDHLTQRLRKEPTEELMKEQSRLINEIRDSDFIKIEDVRAGLDRLEDANLDAQKMQQLKKKN